MRTDSDRDETIAFAIWNYMTKQSSLLVVFYRNT